MKTFYEPDEKGRMKITESRGSKKPIKVAQGFVKKVGEPISMKDCLLYTSPSPRDDT